MVEVTHTDIVIWTESEAAQMHAQYRKKAGIPAAGTEALFAVAIVGYRKRDATAQAEIEAKDQLLEKMGADFAQVQSDALRAHNEIEALREALDEIGRYTGDDAGHLVCIALRTLAGEQP